ASAPAVPVTSSPARAGNWSAPRRPAAIPDAAAATAASRAGAAGPRIGPSRSRSTPRIAQHRVSRAVTSWAPSIAAAIARAWSVVAAPPYHRPTVIKSAAATPALIQPIAAAIPGRPAAWIAGPSRLLTQATTPNRH